MKPGGVWFTTADVKIREVRVAAYTVGGFLGLVVTGWQGPESGFMTMLVTFTGFELAAQTFRLGNAGWWHRVVAELIVPGMLWWMFGLGGIVALARPQDLRRYGSYSDLTVVLVALIAAAAAGCYLIAFRALYGRFVSRRQDDSKAQLFPQNGLVLLLIVVLLLDWYVRWDQINHGYYFKWIAKVTFAAESRSGSSLYFLQEALGSVSLALLVYFSTFKRGWSRLLSLILLAGGILLTIGSGDRSDLLFDMAIVFMSYATLREVRLRPKWLAALGVSGIVFFGVVSPIIQEARYHMRADAATLLANPTHIPVEFITTYLPRVARLDIILGRSDDVVRTSGMVARTGAYMSYAASMYEQLRSGGGLRPKWERERALMLPIPAALLRQKRTLDADAALMEYYDIGVPGNDSSGNPLSDVLSFFGVLGAVFLYGLYGAGFAVVFAYLVTGYGVVGRLIALGLTPAVLPMGDAFGGIIVDLRNVVLFLPVVWLCSRLRRWPRAVRSRGPVTTTDL